MSDTGRLATGQGRQTPAGLRHDAHRIGAAIGAVAVAVAVAASGQASPTKGSVGSTVVGESDGVGAASRPPFCCGAATGETEQEQVLILIDSDRLWLVE